MIRPPLIWNRSLFFKKGFSLVEMLVYVFIFTLLLSIIIGVLYSLIQSYRVIRSAEIIESSAIVSLDRMAREIRDATNIDLANSTLGSNPGVLALNTTLDDGSATTVQFFLNNQTLRIKEADVDIGPLSSSFARVTNLVFRSISTAQSKAVKIEMTIESGQGRNYKSKSFYETVVLRGSYAP